MVSSTLSISREVAEVVRKAIQRRMSKSMYAFEKTSKFRIDEIRRAYVNLGPYQPKLEYPSPLITPDTNAHCGINQNSEDFVVSPDGFHSSGKNSMELDRQRPSVIFDVGIDIDFEVEAGGIFQRSDSVKSKSCLSHEHRHTNDVIQLASHIQRVKQQRNSMQLKQENVCSFPTM
ncbi:uncharacterized protein LOC114256570 [Camellia sinensis]|uniref:uncharacterized protein LOC114256570 n=1 Tax=Camellia sinensis TaxID=4442 RepID=UPI0010356A3F|nr:uncharacterized protein LOC114256570 [Camellia sinensis]